MLVIAGKNNIAVNAINYLKKNYTIDFSVVCNKADIGEHSWQRSLKKTAKKLGVKEITLEEAYEVAACFISLEFDRLIKPELFKKAKAFNIHFSKLPKYKGMYTSVWPILNGEKVVGVTLHEIDSGIDTGDVIDQIDIEIDLKTNARELYDKYLKAAYKLFVRNLDSILNDSYISHPQSMIGSSYYSGSSINFKENKIDINQTAYSVASQIRGFCFREYQLPEIHNKVVVNYDFLTTRSTKKPGVIINEGRFCFDLSTVDYDIRIYEDRMNDIGRFASCNIGEAKDIVKGLCGICDRNEKGWSPIIIAARYGNYSVVKYLLENGADVNDMDFEGASVLMHAKEYAIKYGCRIVFDYLLEVGADLEYQDFDNKKLIDYLTNDEKYFLRVNANK